MSLHAQLDIEPEASERRASRRRKLLLHAEGVSGSTSRTEVIIHDLSEDGLLVESPIALNEGEMLEVEIPEAGTVQAEVAWSSERFFGCRFNHPISTAAVSAALLRSPSGGTTAQNGAAVEKALVELEALSFAIKRVTRAVDQAIERLAKKND